MKKALYSTAFTVVLCAISAGTVTFARMYCSPIIKMNQEYARNSAVVLALGLLQKDQASKAAVSGMYRDNVEILTKKGVTTYKGKLDGKVVSIGMEFRGMGLEGPIEGILGVKPDKATIVGLRFSHQEETPGLGARIVLPEFLDQFPGKKIVAPDGEPGMQASKRAKAVNEFDALTGATLTSKAVARMLTTRIIEFVSGRKLASLDIKLPKVVFVPPYKAYHGGPALPSDKKRKPLSAPEGTKNLAMGLKVGGSDEEPIVGEMEMITDGNKEGGEEHFVEFFGGEHIQVDLGAVYSIHHILIWRDHGNGSVHTDLIVQISNDAEFADGVTTLFNNDKDNSAEKGVGTDDEYYETYEGQHINVRGKKARHVRIFSGGNREDDMSRFVELEIYGDAGGDADESGDDDGAGLEK